MDLLSDLPLCIIHVILSRIPIRDAVRTSFLSHKWRYIWASLPYLAFDDKCVSPPMETESDEKRLIIFITHALLLHQGPVHKFQLRLPPMVQNSQCINRWLPFFSRNGIRNLLLESCDIDSGSGIDVNSSLYSCQSLTNLKLHVYAIPPPPPSFKGFLFLRSLDIRVFVVNTHIIESIVAHSPLLEELALDGIEYSKMTICALNLKYLHFMSPFDDLSLSTPLLQELNGSFQGTSRFSIGVEPLVFHHLRTIKLSSVPFDNKQVTPAVIHLVTSSPNLQNLEIFAWDSWTDDLPEVVPVWDTKSAPDFTYNSLKVIEICNSRGKIDAMKLIEFLLARSPGLETLMYKLCSDISETKLLNLTTQLLRYRRASANAQIVISKKRRRC